MAFRSTLARQATRRAGRPVIAGAVAFALAAAVAVVVEEGASAQQENCFVGTQQTVTFNATGQEQCYTVPYGVDQLQVTLAGGAGGRGAGANGGAGGNGAVVTGTISVSSYQGQNLYVEVGQKGQDGGSGGAGGFNGGGNGYSGTGFPNGIQGGGGGGASDIQTASCTQTGCAGPTSSSGVLIAAGGGGGGGGSGQSSGNLTGAAGGPGGDASVANPLDLIGTGGADGSEPSSDQPGFVPGGAGASYDGSGGEDLDGLSGVEDDQGNFYCPTTASSQSPPQNFPGQWVLEVTGNNASGGRGGDGSIQNDFSPVIPAWGGAGGGGGGGWSPGVPNVGSGGGGGGEGGCHVPPGGSNTIQAAGGGGGAGGFSYGGTVSTENSNSGDGYVTISLLPAVATPSPTQLTFPTTQVGDSSVAQAVQLKNTGHQPLTVTQAAVIGGGEFSIQSNSCLSASIAPGSTCEIDVVFTPSTSGSVTASLDVSAQDSYDQLQVSVAPVSLSGTGSTNVVSVANLTQPTGGQIFLDNQAAGQGQSVAVQGTSNGTANSSVKIYCFHGSQLVAAGPPGGIPTDSSGNFSASVPPLDGFFCTQLVAGSATQPPDPTTYAGAGQSNIGFASFAAPPGDFNLTVPLQDATLYDSSFNDCGPSVTLWDGSDLQNRNAFTCAGALHGSPATVNTGTSADLTRSEIQIDGKDAYGPLDAIKGGLLYPGDTGQFTLQSFDNQSGDATVSEQAPLLECGGSCSYPPPSSVPLFPSPISLSRTTHVSDAGHVATFTDTFTNSDTAAHTVDLLYEVDLSQVGQTEASWQLPGESYPHQHATGDSAPGPSSSAPDALDVFSGGPPSATTPEGALTYAAPYQDIRFDNTLAAYKSVPLESGLLHYVRTIPAGGSVTLSFSVATAASSGQLAGYVAAAKAQFAPPPIQITSPADGSTISTPSATITGKVSAPPSGIQGLTVDGQSVPVASDGTFTVTVPLTVGQNTITATATSGAGSYDSVQLHLTYAPPGGPQANPPAAPQATTSPAGAIHAHTATLAGSVIPGSAPVSYYFQYGPTAAYGSQTPAGSLPAGAGQVALQRQVAGLKAHTTYHFRLVASSSAGMAVGVDRTFTTLYAPRGLTLAGRPRPLSAHAPALSAFGRLLLPALPGLAKAHRRAGKKGQGKAARKALALARALCRGTVAVQVVAVSRRGARVLAAKRVRVRFVAAKVACTYHADLPLAAGKLPRRGTVRVLAQYLGSALLDQVRARPLRIPVR